uniref:Biosis of lysosomal organelles complex 1 subunit 4 n=1 Tax=Loxodonta africana TaxID=9785 RepID=G3TXW1_LOXAF
MESGPACGALRREESAEDPEPAGAAWSGDSGDSGNVSQSHSSASGPWEDEGPEDVEALDAGLEDLLARVDEFVGMLDMIRGDSAHVVGQGVPRIHARAAEMRRLYGRIDRLEAFVTMVGGGVARLEEQVARAEAERGAFPGALRKLLSAVGVPSFLARPAAPPRHEAPVLFRTEDHFPCCGE